MRLPLRLLVQANGVGARAALVSPRTPPHIRFAVLEARGGRRPLARRSAHNTERRALLNRIDGQLTASTMW